MLILSAILSFILAIASGIYSYQTGSVGAVMCGWAGSGKMSSNNP